MLPPLLDELALLTFLLADASLEGRPDAELEALLGTGRKEQELQSLKCVEIAGKTEVNVKPTTGNSCTIRGCG